MDYESRRRNLVQLLELTYNKENVFDNEFGTFDVETIRKSLLKALMEGNVADEMKACVDEYLFFCMNENDGIDYFIGNFNEIDANQIDIDESFISKNQEENDDTETLKFKIKRKYDYKDINSIKPESENTSKIASSTRKKERIISEIEDILEKWRNMQVSRYPFLILDTLEKAAEALGEKKKSLDDYFTLFKFSIQIK